LAASIVDVLKLIFVDIASAKDRNKKGVTVPSLRLFVGLLATLLKNLKLLIGSK